MTVQEILQLRRTWHYASAISDTAASVAELAFTAAVSGTPEDIAAVKEAVAEVGALNTKIAALWAEPIISQSQPEKSPVQSVSPHKR